MISIICMTLFASTYAIHCDKEFDYNENYGNGYDISCQGITSAHLHLLANITINNEIKLKIDNSSLLNVSSKLFNNVRDIRRLSVIDSTFTYPPGHAVFANLSRLEHLEIRNTPFVVSKTTFNGLTNLMDLELSGNHLEEVVPGSFSKLKNLRDLQITHNKLDDIADIPMCELMNLRFLNLSSNIISSIKRKVFSCSHSNEGMDLKLNSRPVSIYQNNYLRIRDYYLELTNFDVSYNQIADIGGALNYLKFITVLNLQGNRLKRIRNSDLSALQDLERLNLQNNQLEAIEDEVLQGKENLELVDVSHNKLTYLNLKNTPMLKYLNLGDNKLDLDVINNITRPKSLETLIFSKNEISDIPLGTFDKFHLLEILDLSDNSITLANHSFSGLRMLRSLIIRNSSITLPPGRVFKDLRSLEYLDLSHNKLKTLPDEIFNILENLGVLNISYNALEEFDYVLVRNLSNLRVLDIAGNKLKYIQYELIMSNLPFLSVLNIKSNLFSCEFLSKIINFFKSKHVTYTTAEKFSSERENIAGIYCQNENATSGSLMSSNSRESSHALINMSIVVVIVLVVILISMLLYKMYIYLKRRKYKVDEFELIQD